MQQSYAEAFVENQHVWYEIMWTWSDLSAP